MFIHFFQSLRQSGVPVSLKEYLMLMEALDEGLADWSVETFYYLSRAALVKDESNLDKFDRVFGHVFKGLDLLSDSDQIDLPEDWLKKLAELHLSPEEMEQIKSLGDFDQIMETLKKRLEEQKERHQGGNKWIGTAGRSPYGAYGYNPEGVRIGQKESRHRRAIKVWDKRAFRNFDDQVELGTRSIKVALGRLRQFARTGALDEFDLDDTIRSTAKKGYLDIKMRPERHNAVKILLFLDVGGSMDDHVKITEELFSAARSEFKYLEFFYFHNCLYESVWKDNRRRHQERIDTWQILHSFPADYKLIFVGDASMSPYEIVYPGGSVEHWNEESGETWMRRALGIYSKAVWLNPIPAQHWSYSQSLTMIRELMKDRMFPLTLAGLNDAIRALV
ncbi:VWA domain-containing protein [Iodidimonas nitroreducens]|uniref:VWA domain-containing protein n=1 Tax=Iodidimonas nitroreducens TaxID=1236968 RepID=A0A5A7N6X0_9PROT|nr:VWA domain-containing protein [Iodidimonas nitroreducens]GAK32279.1 VWA domain containing CoxE-like protein [alpha proteobacterium Q-1]GER03395.1 VWA domain-containing protein [Iodidimonas nitroreducens]